MQHTDLLKELLKVEREHLLKFVHLLETTDSIRFNEPILYFKGSIVKRPTHSMQLLHDDTGNNCKWKKLKNNLDLSVWKHLEEKKLVRIVEHNHTDNDSDDDTYDNFIWVELTQKGLNKLVEYTAS